MNKAGIFIGPMNCVTPLGLNLDHTWDALLQGKSGIAAQPPGLLPDAFYAARISREDLHAKSTDQGSDLYKMMFLALRPMMDGLEAPDARTGLIVSTTKGDIDALERHDVSSARLGVLAKKLAARCGFVTDPIVVSNACVSGIMAIGVGKRLLEIGMFDRIFVVAGDLVTRFVLSGFNSFQAMSNAPCRPYSAQRSGVTLGEAAAAVYMSLSVERAFAEVLGEASINDANHISGPSRTGEGLFQSVSSALAEAKISPSDIGFISAHGTATAFNDEMESIAFDRSGLVNTPLHSLKGYFGHTLGASGLLETVLALKAMQSGKMLGSKGFDTLGVSRPINVLAHHRTAEYDYLLKTASGFGGCNTAVVFKKVVA